MDDKRYNKPSEDLLRIKFGDKRLDKRLKNTVETMEEQNKGTILGICENKHAAKAFYSLLSNGKFKSEKIHEVGYEATRERIKSSGLSRILLVQDTSDINLNGHKKTEELGYCSEHVRGVRLFLLMIICKYYC